MKSSSNPIWLVNRFGPAEYVDMFTNNFLSFDEATSNGRKLHTRFSVWVMWLMSYWFHCEHVKVVNSQTNSPTYNQMVRQRERESSWWNYFCFIDISDFAILNWKEKRCSICVLDFVRSICGRSREVWGNHNNHSPEWFLFQSSIHRNPSIWTQNLCSLLHFYSLCMRVACVSLWNVDTRHAHVRQALSRWCVCLYAHE